MATIEVSRIMTDGTVKNITIPENVLFFARLLGAKFGGKGNEKALTNAKKINQASVMEYKEIRVTVDGVVSTLTKSDVTKAIAAMKNAVPAYQKCSKLAAELKAAKAEYQNACKSVTAFVKVTGKDVKESAGKVSKRAVKQNAADEEMK